MVSRNKFRRENLYRSIFLFSIVYILLIFFQKKILVELLDIDLFFSISSVISIVTSKNILAEIINQGISGIILSGIFLFSEIIIFVLLFIYFLYQFWCLYKNSGIKSSDYMLLIGLNILFFSSVYYLYLFISISVATYRTVHDSFDSLSHIQFLEIENKLIELFSVNPVSLDSDLFSIIKEFNILTSEFQVIRQISNIVNEFLDTVIDIKFYYFSFLYIGFFVLLVILILEHKLIITSFKNISFKLRR